LLKRIEDAARPAWAHRFTAAHRQRTASAPKSFCRRQTAQTCGGQ
jgi:hypothetical protein